MKKHTEKPPIDELFARKLGNTSLPPSDDGFARLQARMGRNTSRTKVVFWRNPDSQRYTAAAACLLLFCVLGWRYWPSTSHVSGQKQVAMSQSVDNSLKKAIQRPSGQHRPEEPQAEIIEKSVFSQNSTKDQVAVANKAERKSEMTNSSDKQSVERTKSIEPALPVRVAPVIAQIKSNENRSQSEPVAPTTVASASQPKIMPVEQVADTKPINKPTPVAERVLVVTIAEPEAMVAARQMAKVVIEEKTAIAQNEKAEKEAKGGSFWQQVKRIKQGEVFARQDNTNNEESGLLGRAYNGLKHSLDKDKSAKQ